MGALRLHLPSAKFPIHYLADSPTLIPLSEMGNGIPNRTKTTWPNTDTSLNYKEFYEHDVNRGIATHDMGGVALFNDSMERIRNVGN